MRRCSAVLSVLSAILGPVGMAGGTQIYWSTGFGQTIERANVDGTGREVVVRTTNLPGEIALDSAHGQIYWTGLQGRGVWRANLDGTGSQKIVSPSGDPGGIAIDSARGEVYWAEGYSTNRIMRANLDGAARETLITTAAGYPEGLALDLVHEQMYWMNIETSEMFRSNLDGTGTTRVLTTGVSPVALALDVKGGKVYWTENGASYPAYDVIKRANLDGSGIETLVTGLWNPLGIALDLRAGKVYWADHGQGKIQRANLDGTGIEDILTGIGSPEFITLDLPEPGSVLLILLGAYLCRKVGRKRFGYVSPILALCLWFPAAVQAKTIYVDESAPAGGNGQTWATAYQDLQSALNPGVAADGDEIRVAEGTYKPSRKQRNPEGTGYDNPRVYTNYNNTTCACRTPASCSCGEEKGSGRKGVRSEWH